MMRQLFAAAAAFLAAGCASVPQHGAGPPVEVQILAFNDFHGNLETPPPVEVTQPDGAKLKITTGGAAHLAAALASFRVGHPNTVTVSAGDTIGASPLISAYYLDEPTIDAMNMTGVELNSVGNHEFDKGQAELLRKQNGGCYPGGEPNSVHHTLLTIDEMLSQQKKWRAGSASPARPAA